MLAQYEIKTFVDCYYSYISLLVSAALKILNHQMGISINSKLLIILTINQEVQPYFIENIAIFRDVQMSEKQNVYYSDPLAYLIAERLHLSPITTGLFAIPFVTVLYLFTALVSNK